MLALPEKKFLYDGPKEAQNQPASKFISKERMRKVEAYLLNGPN